MISNENLKIAYQVMLELEKSKTDSNKNSITQVKNMISNELMRNFLNIDK